MRVAIGKGSAAQRADPHVLGGHRTGLAGRHAVLTTEHRTWVAILSGRRLPHLPLAVTDSIGALFHQHDCPRPPAGLSCLPHSLLPRNVQLCAACYRRALCAAPYPACPAHPAWHPCRLPTLCSCRFAAPLGEAHDAEHLTKFEELLEAAIDLDRVPDEYLIAASYDQARLSLVLTSVDVDVAWGCVLHETSPWPGMTCIFLGGGSECQYARAFLALGVCSEGGFGFEHAQARHLSPCGPRQPSQAVPAGQELEGLQVEKEGVEAEIGRLAQEAARDLGLTLDKTIKWVVVDVTRWILILMGGGVCSPLQLLNRGCGMGWKGRARSHACQGAPLQYTFWVPLQYTGTCTCTASCPPQPPNPAPTHPIPRHPSPCSRLEWCNASSQRITTCATEC